VPTPVGPLGPEEIDPDDPDLWDWDAASSRPVKHPTWIRMTAWAIAIMFALVVIASFLR
jgi:hypothetical protein